MAAAFKRKTFYYSLLPRFSSLIRNSHLEYQAAILQFIRRTHITILRYIPRIIKSLANRHRCNLLTLAQQKLLKNRAFSNFIFKDICLYVVNTLCTN